MKWLTLLSAVAVTGYSIAFATLSKAKDDGQWVSNDPAIRQWYQSLMQPDNLASGSHERCGSPFCRKRFPFTNGKFQRVKRLDEQWYCDAVCASRHYLTQGAVNEKTL